MARNGAVIDPPGVQPAKQKHTATASWPERAWAGFAPFAGLVSVLVLLCAFFTITQPQFATYDNLLNILETNASLIVVSVGLTFVMLVGGFDLSIGGVVVLSGVVLAKLITSAGIPVAVAIPLVILGAGAFGAVANGMTIAKLGLSFFVVTLGTLTMTRGAALLIAGGETQDLYDEKVIRWIGGGDVITSALPAPAVLALLVLVIGALILRFTGYGRIIYAVGGNPEAARLAGINITAIRVSAYAISGALAGLAGIMDAGRLAAASPDGAQGLELTAAAAVLLGGTSFVGGSGTLIGTLLGALFLGVVQNGLIIAEISVYWQGVVTGGVLILSVLADRVRRGRAATT
jgi:ribose transport system permease protein